MNHAARPLIPRRILFDNPTFSVPVVGITNFQTLLESMPPYWAGFAEYMYRHLGGACEPAGNDFDGSSHEVRAGKETLGEPTMG